MGGQTSIATGLAGDGEAVGALGMDFADLNFLFFDGDAPSSLLSPPVPLSPVGLLEAERLRVM